MKRKLQVFVSSTYSDLQIERLACVEAILKSGHIPAGMELFSAGNEGQLEIIKRWIKECDVYMLLLGGRYGSIEPKSGTSYTEIEYMYAQELDKPMFAIVITDKYLDQKVKKYGKNMIEFENNTKYKVFKELVLSKISRFYSNENDIRLSVMESLIDIQNRFKLTGWIKATEFEILHDKVKTVSIPVEIKDAVSGKWEGKYEQILNGALEEIDVYMFLEVSRKGKIIGKATIPYGEDAFEANLKGGFYLRSFIKLEYENTNKAIIQFGSFVFRLSDRPNKLAGQFVGYGHISEKVISGSIQLKKIKCNS
jgi:hypothetical protein